jgi:UDP-N-acetylmuramyl pentapeptide synthase
MEEEIAYTLHLTPPQLKVVHTALKSLLDDFGHDEAAVARAIHEVLDKLPDEHSIRGIEITSR